MGVTTPSPEERPKLRAEARRNIELVLDAAEACLTRDADASMSDIAAEAGLGRVTIFGYFASRQILIKASVRRVLGLGDAALDELDLSADAAAPWNGWSMRSGG
jgi:TetR/AcrR family transcriptional repressor of mexCD-oprJ operon